MNPEAQQIQQQIAQLQQRLQQLQSGGNQNVGAQVQTSQQPQQQQAAQPAQASQFNNYAQALGGQQGYGQPQQMAGGGMNASMMNARSAQPPQAARTSGFNSAAQIGGGAMPTNVPVKSLQRQQWEQWNQG